MRNEMKQLALKLDCYVLGASAFGVFIRWLQLQIAFDDNGLCGSSSLNVAVVLIVLAAAAVFYRFIKRMKAQQFVPRRMRRWPTPDGSSPFSAGSSAG